jgi:hypothetical protein
MKIIEKIKSLIRRRPLTDEELAARADVEAMRERARQENAELTFERKACRPSLGPVFRLSSSALTSGVSPCGSQCVDRSTRAGSTCLLPASA